jgi:hypothetical protein
MVGVTGAAANVIALLLLEIVGVLGLGIAWFVVGANARGRWADRIRRQGWAGTIVFTVSQMLITISAAGLVSGHGTILSYFVGYLVVGCVFGIEFGVYARLMRLRHPDEWRQWVHSEDPTRPWPRVIRRGFYWYLSVAFASVLVLVGVVLAVAPGMLEGWD